MKEFEHICNAHPSHLPRFSATQERGLRSFTKGVRICPLPALSASDSCFFDDLPRVRCSLPRLGRGLHGIAILFPSPKHRALRPACYRGPPDTPHAPRADLAVLMPTLEDSVNEQKLVCSFLRVFQVWPCPQRPPRAQRIRHEAKPTDSIDHQQIKPLPDETEEVD